MHKMPVRIANSKYQNQSVSEGGLGLGSFGRLKKNQNFRTFTVYAFYFSYVSSCGRS